MNDAQLRAAKELTTKQGRGWITPEGRIVHEDRASLSSRRKLVLDGWVPFVSNHAWGDIGGAMVANMSMSALVITGDKIRLFVAQRVDFHEFQQWLLQAVDETSALPQGLGNAVLFAAMMNQYPVYGELVCKLGTQRREALCRTPHNRY